MDRRDSRLINFHSSESLSEAWHHVDEAVDQLLYFQDLFALEVSDVAEPLMDSLMEVVIFPLFLEGLLEGSASVQVCACQPQLVRVRLPDFREQDTALFMLTHILASVTYIPILELIIRYVFGGACELVL